MENHHVVHLTLSIILYNYISKLILKVFNEYSSERKKKLKKKNHEKAANLDAFQIFESSDNAHDKFLMKGTAAHTW